jgi:hypothetical protein
MNNSLSLSISFKPHQTLDYAKTSPFPMSCVFLLALASFSHIRNQKVLLFLYYAIVISPNSLSHVLLVLVLHMFFSPSHVVLKGLGWTFTFWSLRSESFWCGDIKRLGWRFCFSFVSFFFRYHGQWVNSMYGFEYALLHTVWGSIWLGHGIYPTNNSDVAKFKV